MFDSVNDFQQHVRNAATINECIARRTQSTQINIKFVFTGRFQQKPHDFLHNPVRSF